jgi:hypothetical protein
MSGLQRGREAGTPKTGGATKGAIIKRTLGVKDAILRVFEEANIDDEYLKNLANSEKKLFLGLLARIIPQSQELQVDQTVNVNLGAAMAESAARLEQEYVQTMRNVTPVNAPLTQADAQRIYGTPGEQPLPDPKKDPDHYRVEPQPHNKELWAGYDDEGPKPGQRKRRKVV